MVTFGDIGLYFMPDASALLSNKIVASTATIRPEDESVEGAELDELVAPEETTFAGFPKIKTQFFHSSAGGAGLLDMNETRIQLTLAQLELMSLLVKQMQDDVGMPIEVRGFVPSSQLVDKVTWDSPFPTDNHLKQLIRRVRRILENAEMGNLIESRRGFGYRLRCIPIDVEAK